MIFSIYPLNTGVVVYNCSMNSIGWRWMLAFYSTLVENQTIQNQRWVSQFSDKLDSWFWFIVFVFQFKVQEWLRRADKFSTLCQSVLVLSRKIACCTNRELVYDLFSYVWDIAGVISLLNAFVKWLSLGTFPVNINSYTQGSYTCKSMCSQN